MFAFSPKSVLANGRWRHLWLALPLLSGAATASAIESGAVSAEIQPLADKSLLLDIVRVGGSAMAVGERGHLMALDGDRWQQVLGPVDTMLTKTFFADESRGWSVGHDASIIATTDGGQHWTLQHFQPSADRPLFDVYFRNANEGIAIGAYGMFLRTTDGGKSWSKQFLDSLLPVEDREYLQELKETSIEDYEYEQASILPHFNRLIPLSGNRLMLVGELGLIALSDDFGATWRRLPEIYPGSFFTALEASPGTLLVGGLRGNLYRSADNGENWQAVSLPDAATINSLYRDEKGYIYLVNNSGTLLRSDDQGQSFELVTRFKGQELVGVTRIGDVLWLAGSKGLQPVKLGESL